MITTLLLALSAAGCLDLPPWAERVVPLEETAHRGAGITAPPSPGRSAVAIAGDPGYGDGECPPDRFEGAPGDDLPELPPGEHRLLSLCEGDKDRYRVALQAGDAVYALVSGARGLRLELRSPDGRPLAVSRGFARGGHLGVGRIDVAGEHLLVVSGDGPVSRYSLRWSVTPLPGGAGGEGEGEGEATAADPACRPVGPTSSSPTTTGRTPCAWNPRSCST